MTQTSTETPSPEVVARLVGNYQTFLGFLERRLGDRETAEEVLQNAFARTLTKGGTIRESESAVAWFYRLLRNAIADHHRHRAVEARALKRSAEEPRFEEMELREAICACMRTLIPNLKDEYAQILERTDLDETPVREVAEELGITPNNASVRLHRARLALKRELERSCGACATHGCLECSCKASR